MTLENASADAISVLTTWAKSGAAFVSEQAPELAKEVVAWHIAKAGITAIFCLIAIVVANYGAIWMLKTFPKETSGGYDDNEIPRGFAYIGRIVITLGCLVGVASNVAEVAKGIYAPRLVVLEALQKAVK